MPNFIIWPLRRLHTIDARAFTAVVRPSAVAGSLLLLCLFTSCERIKNRIAHLFHSEEESTQKTNIPPTLPRQTYSLSKLWSGVSLRADMQAEPGDLLASVDRNNPNNYEVSITLKIRLPKASITAEELAVEDPKLPHLLNDFSTLVETSSLSPAFAQIYQNKLERNRVRLLKLDELISRHNFFDCQTILQFAHPATGRRALLMQGDMDVNTDGSDGDRNVVVDDTSLSFQPQTSYRWRKQTNRPNPYLAPAQEQLKELEKQLAASDLSDPRKQELRTRAEATKRRIYDLKTYSFLSSTADPFIVLPGFMFSQKGPFAPALGDYAIVIHNSNLYPAIVGDAGPSFKFGEASIRICAQIDPKSSGIRRAVSDLKVTYLVFPGTADKKFTAPDIDAWYDKCTALLNELGGSPKDLHRWENIVKPWPTPTPTPSPTPSPLPTSTPSSTPAEPSPSPLPSPTPEQNSSEPASTQP